VIDFACPNQDEVELLKQHYRRTPGTVSQRAHAILLSALEKTAYDIAQVLFLEEKTVREWIKRWHKERLASIFSKNHCNENAAKLTRIQKKEIARVLSQPPSDYGIPRNFWEVKSLKSYIKAEFGVEYESDNSYRFIFKLHNFSFHLPAKFDLKRDERVVIKRLIEIRKIIKPYFTDPSWVILVADESRLVWEAIIRRAWLPKGKRTILKVVRSKDYQNFFGCLNLKTGRAHLYQIPWQNQKEIIKVLKILQKEYPHKHLCLIWDNASFHKGRLLRKELKINLKSFYLLNLPPYAPDTNPQEHIWEYAKEEISNQQYGNMKELTDRFRKIVIGRNYLYQI
jgi:transposase